MDRLDLAELLIDKSEAAVSVPVKTRGAGDHAVPTILISDVNADRRAEGNSAKAGLNDSTGDGTDDELVLAHIYEASATIESRSEDEVQSYTLLKSIYDSMAVYEEVPEAFHSELNDFSLGRLKQGGFQAPTPEPVFKHTFSVSLDFNNSVKVALDSDTTGEPISTIDTNISNN